MKSVQEHTCYYCGRPANDSSEHVPPEVFFRGVSGKNYKLPKIITVPSCTLHNKDASMIDERLAWVIADACCLASYAAMDVQQSLMASVNDRIWKDRKFSDSRLAQMGIRIFHDADDYDENGQPKQRKYDTGYIIAAEKNLRDKWSEFKVGIKKIAAGVYYHATNGIFLGEDQMDKLCIAVPDFKQIGPEISLSGLSIDVNDYFKSKLTGWEMPEWRSISSGSAKIFQCHIACNMARRH
jgi:hypothetical protein